MSDRWKTEPGLRLDGYNFQIPTQAGAPASIPAVEHQRLYEPHFDLSYAPDQSRHDSFRLRPHALDAAAQSARRRRRARRRTPPSRGFRRTTTRPAKPRSYCGPLANALCGNYADQLYWLTRDYRYGSSTLEAPLVGATFTNFDLSWAHEFRDGAAFKLTPFYRRGYNVIEQTAQIIGYNYQTGSPVFGDVAVFQSGDSKSGRHRSALQPKTSPSGVSMQIGATYISQFGNEPPGTFLQPAALALGTVYRSPDLSPFQINAAFNYKSAKGWRINPVIGFNVGYPYGAGYYTAVYCNGIPVIVPYVEPLDRSTRRRRATSIRSIPARAPSRISRRRAAFTNRALPADCSRRRAVDADLTVEYRPPTHESAQRVGLWRAGRQSVQSALQRTGLSTAATARR